MVLTIDDVGFFRMNRFVVGIWNFRIRQQIIFKRIHKNCALRYFTTLTKSMQTCEHIFVK